MPTPLRPAVGIGLAGVCALGLWVTGPLAWAASELGYGLDQQFQRLGFQVGQVEISGLDGKPKTDVMAAMRVYSGQSILGLSLRDVKSRVESVDWVQEAHVMRLLPHTVYVAVTPRHPFALWQNNGRVYVIDETGMPIRAADVKNHMHLPLVVGEGAEQHAQDMIAALARYPRVAEEVQALIFVGNRRWNLRLNSGADVMLPEVGAEAALARLQRLEAENPILKVPMDRIDLRIDGKMALRPIKEKPKPAREVTARLTSGQEA